MDGTARKQRLRTAALGFSGLAIFVALWELAASGVVFSAALIPRPSDVPATFIAEIERGVWQRMVLSSLRHYGLGLAIGTVLGIVQGEMVMGQPRPNVWFVSGGIVLGFLVGRALWRRANTAKEQ